MTATIKSLMICLAQCRAQFAFYAEEHRKADKTVKAATNQRFAYMIDRALVGVEPQVHNPTAWFMASRFDSEWWTNGGADRDETIVKGREFFADKNDDDAQSFWIVEAKRLVPCLDRQFDGSVIIDSLQDSEVWGEDGWEGAGDTDELERRLTATLRQWFNETCTLDGAGLDFVHGPEEVQLS